MAKERQMPELVFIGPPKRRGRYKHTLFRVLERDGQGIPTMLKVVPDDATVHIQGGEDFMTGYVPATVFALGDRLTDIAEVLGRAAERGNDFACQAVALETLRALGVTDGLEDAVGTVCMMLEVAMGATLF